MALCLILLGEQQHAFAELKTLVGCARGEELPELDPPDLGLNKLPIRAPSENPVAVELPEFEDEPREEEDGFLYSESKSVARRPFPDDVVEEEDDVDVDGDEDEEGFENKRPSKREKKPPELRPLED